MSSYPRGLAAVLRGRRVLEAALITSQALGLITSIIIARSLGPAGRGIITTVALWAQMLAWTGCFSFDQAVAVLVRREDMDLDEAMHTARRTVGAISGVVAVIGCVVYFAVTGSVALTVVLGASVVFGAFLELNMGRLLALQDEKRFALARIIQPATYTTAVMLVWLVTKGLDVTGPARIGLFGSAFAGSIVVGSLVTHRATSGRARNRAAVRRVRRRLGSFAVRAYPAWLFQFLNGRLDVLLVSLLLARSEVGLYAVAAAGGQNILFLGSAAATRGVSGVAKGIDRRALIAVVALAGAGILAAPWTVQLVFGSAFLPSVDAARILLLGSIPGYVAAGAYGRLIGAGRPVAAAAAQASGVVGLIVAVLLGPRNIEYVAVVSAASYVIAAVVGLVLARGAKVQPAVAPT